MGGAYTAVRGEVVVVRRLGGGDHTPVASGAQLETEPEPGLGTHCLQTVITHTGDTLGGPLMFVITSISFVRVRGASKSSVFPCFQPQSPCPVWLSQLTVTQWCHRSPRITRQCHNTQQRRHGGQALQVRTSKPLVIALQETQVRSPCD